MSLYFRAADGEGQVVVGLEKKKKKQLLPTLYMPEHTLNTCNKLGVKSD